MQKMSRSIPRDPDRRLKTDWDQWERDIWMGSFKTRILRLERDVEKLLDEIPTLREFYQLENRCERLEQRVEHLE